MYQVIQWIDRFRAVEKPLQAALPFGGQGAAEYARGRQSYSIWQRNNLWTLHNALAYGGKERHTDRLVNGKAGDGPGDQGYGRDQARARGAKVIVLDTNALFGL